MTSRRDQQKKNTSIPGTPFEKIWDQHVVRELADGRTLVHIDRHFPRESTSGRAFDGLRGVLARG
jgi:homoaconitase/3-isopropylmalate dehydratase large subunit